MRFVLPLLSRQASSLNVAVLNKLHIAKQIHFLEPLLCPTDFVSEFDFPGLCSWYCDQIQVAIDQYFPLSDRVARFAVLVDRADLTREKFGLLADDPCWEQLVAILIMAFPDVSFYFAVPYFAAPSNSGEAEAELPAGAPETPADTIETIAPETPADTIETIELEKLRKIISAHSIAALLSADWSTGLFDQSGLRNFLRNRKVDDKDLRFEFPSRRDVAAVIDDELDYAIFHALAAYRFGYRGAVINSRRVLAKHFTAPANFDRASDGPHGFTLLFEDMSLNFFDKKCEDSFILFEERGKTFKYLDETYNKNVNRVLVTTGQGRSWAAESNEDLEKNKVYLKIKDHNDLSPGKTDTLIRGIRELVLKPSGGFIDFWFKAGLLSPSQGGQRAGNAAGFIWPHDGRSQKDLENRPSSDDKREPHGSLGGHALTIALALRRAQHLRRSASSIYDLSVVCVLATDAVEMVAGKSMHLGIEALLLKHEVEVEIESRFNGIGYHVDAKRRLEEIELECGEFSTWIDSVARERFNMDAQLSVLTRLSGIYFRSGLLEEYETCIQRIRSLNRDLIGLKSSSTTARLSFLRSLCDAAKKLLLRAENEVLRYCEGGLASFWAIIWRIFWAQTVLAVTWWHIWGRSSNCSGRSDCSDHLRALESISKVTNMFWTQNIENGSHGMLVFSLLVAFVSLVHIGLMVAYLYSLVSRR